MPNYQTRTPGPISVTLELGTADVRIAASDRTDTVVEVRPSDEADESDVKTAQQVRVGYAGGVLRVTGPKPGVFDFSRKTRSVEVSIELPSGSRVSLETLAGDVQFAGRLGDSRLKTSAGNFWLEQTGALRLKTGFGHVTAGSIAGSSEISTGSGEIKVGEIEGTAVVRSSNGAISVGRAGAGVDAKTSNGSIRVGEAAGGPVVLGTPAGDLEVGIAEGTATRLAVSAGHGHVRNLLAGATGPEEAGETVEVRGHTSYGDITIHRSRVAASAIERASGEDTGSDGASR